MPDGDGGGEDGLHDSAVEQSLTLEGWTSAAVHLRSWVTVKTLPEEGLFQLVLFYSEAKKVWFKQQKFKLFYSSDAIIELYFSLEIYCITVLSVLNHEQITMSFGV